MTKQIQLEGYKNTLEKLTKREEELVAGIKESTTKQEFLTAELEKVAKKTVEESLPFLFSSKSYTIPTATEEKVFKLKSDFYRVALQHTNTLTQQLQVLTLKNEYEHEINKLEREIKEDAAKQAAEDAEMARLRVEGYGMPHSVFAESARDVMARAEIDGLSEKLRRNQVRGYHGLSPHYIVNEGKGTVVVLLKSRVTGLTHCKAKAKVSPGDVFNENVGKAIALRRSLGLRDLSILTGRKERG